jgi:hypothetical protein
MPVPASYNDITEDREVRDHVGVVWYDRTFYIPQTWNSASMKIWLRFGGVHYAADVVSSLVFSCHYLFNTSVSMSDTKSGYLLYFLLYYFFLSFFHSFSFFILFFHQFCVLVDGLINPFI